MIGYIEANIEEIVCSLPHLLVILAGDFNQLSTNVIAERTGLCHRSSINQRVAPTHWTKS